MTASIAEPTLDTKTLDQLSIDTLRLLAVDEVEKAKSGHPGAPLGCSPIVYLLFHKLMKHNPKHSKWADRDRFVLSNGHASAMLYGVLFLTGYDVTLEDLKSFRQWGSRTPGHPEYGHLDGVEATTGPLGQGIAMAVGMAIAEKHLAAVYNKPGFEVVNHHTFAMLGDGDLMEGVSHEAASLAGTLDVSLANGFVPSQGQSFSFLLAGSGVAGPAGATPNGISPPSNSPSGDRYTASFHWAVVGTLPWFVTVQVTVPGKPATNPGKPLTNVARQFSCVTIKSMVGTALTTILTTPGTE